VKSFLSLALGLCLSGALALGQSSSSQIRPIRIGVAIPRNVSIRTVAVKAQRDRLVHSLEAMNSKKDKAKGRAAIIAVALDTDDREDAADEANKKDCDYVLYTRVTDLRQRGDVGPGTSLGKVIVGSPTAGPPGVETTYGEVEFQVIRVGEPQPVVEATVSGTENENEDTTVSRLLDRVASRVVSEVRKPAGTPTIP
jgi:hypothetical protein